MKEEEKRVFAGKVRKSGNSLVITVPFQVVGRLKLKHNDQVKIEISLLKL